MINRKNTQGGIVQKVRKKCKKFERIGTVCLAFPKWDVFTLQAKVSHHQHAHTVVQHHTGSRFPPNSAFKWSATTQRRVSAHHKSAHSSEIRVALAWFAPSQASRSTASSVQTALHQHSQKRFTISSRRQQTSASTLNAQSMMSIQSTASSLSNQESTDLLVTTRHAELLHQTGSTQHKQPLQSLHKHTHINEHFWNLILIWKIWSELKKVIIFSLLNALSYPSLSAFFPFNWSTNSWNWSRKEKLSFFCF